MNNIGFDIEIFEKRAKLKFLLKLLKKVVSNLFIMISIYLSRSSSINLLQTVV